MMKQTALEKSNKTCFKIPLEKFSRIDFKFVSFSKCFNFYNSIKQFWLFHFLVLGILYSEKVLDRVTTKPTGKKWQYPQCVIFRRILTLIRYSTRLKVNIFFQLRLSIPGWYDIIIYFNYRIIIIRRRQLNIWCV